MFQIKQYLQHLKKASMKCNSKILQSDTISRCSRTSLSVNTDQFNTKSLPLVAWQILQVYHILSNNPATRGDKRVVTNAYLNVYIYTKILKAATEHCIPDHMKICLKILNWEHTKSSYLYLEMVLPPRLPLWCCQSHEMLFWFQKVQVQLVMNVSSPWKYLNKNGKLMFKKKIKVTQKYYNAISAALRQAILPLAWNVFTGVTAFYCDAQINEWETL